MIGNKEKALCRATVKSKGQAEFGTKLLGALTLRTCFVYKEGQKVSSEEKRKEDQYKFGEGMICLIHNWT